MINKEPSYSLGINLSGDESTWEEGIDLIVIVVGVKSGLVMVSPVDFINRIVVSTANWIFSLLNIVEFITFHGDVFSKVLVTVHAGSEILMVMKFRDFHGGGSSSEEEGKSKFH